MANKQKAYDKCNDAIYELFDTAIDMDQGFDFEESKLRIEQLAKIVIDNLPKLKP